MLTVLWSTPRTGSTYYTHYLYSLLRQENSKTYFLRQYLNKFHLNSYTKVNVNDLVYEYDSECSYIQYYIDPLSKKISSNSIHEQRKLDSSTEEAYRIGLLEKTNLEKYPILISQHVQPMSPDSYYYLKNKANRNIFIYRENFIDQLASYVVAVSTQTFHYTKTTRPVTNAEIEFAWLENLSSRIKHWHTLDKTNCEIVKYEDIKFDDSIGTKKQHDVKPIHQVSTKTYNKIMELNENFQNFLQSRQKTF